MRRLAVMATAAVVLLSVPTTAEVPVPFASTAPFQEAPPPPAGKVLVYIYRDPGIAFAVRNAAFYLDDKQFVDLLPSDYTYIYVTAGHHEIKQKWPFWPGDFWLAFKKIEYPVDFVEGQTYYYRFATGVEPGALDWALNPVSPDDGKTALAAKHLQTPDPKVADGL